MIEALLSQAAEAVGGRLVGGDGRFRGVFTDTRKPLSGGLFAALKGERFDGHDFLTEAQRAGAIGVLVREGTETPAGIASIAVDDTLKALGDLAAWYRNSLQDKVIAITGSMGKSTTRRLIASMLPGLVHEAPSSYNNLIGVPLTLLSAPIDAAYVLCEAGINHPGEMERLAQIIQPDVSILTNIASAHLEGLGSLEEAAREKAALLRSTKKDGLIVHGFEGGLVTLWIEDLGVERVGPDDALARVSLLEIDENASGRFRIEGPGGEFEVILPLSPCAGKELLGIALDTVLRLGVGTGEAVAALRERFRPLPGRWSTYRIGKHLAINDAMNANPEATERALEALRLVPVKPKAALLGDMLELGPESRQFHKQVGGAAASAGLDVLLATGEMADSYMRGYREAGGGMAARLEAPVEMGLRAILTRFLPDGGVLLVKASHALALDRLFAGLDE